MVEITGMVPDMGVSPTGRVSCICVTRPERFACLQRAVINFLHQEYEDRELIILVESDGYAEQVKTFLSLTLPHVMDGVTPMPPIHLYSQPFASHTEAMVHAMVWSSGKWICIWDDDNLSHPRRLTRQLKYTTESTATVLTNSLYYFYSSAELFVSGFEQPGGNASDRCAVSSLIFPRKLYPGFDVSNPRQSKDAFSVRFVNLMGGFNSGLMRIPTLPFDFVTGVYADNMRGEEYHRRAATELPTTASRESILERSDEIEQALDGYMWPAKEGQTTGADVFVSGKDAQAFIYEPKQVWDGRLDTTTRKTDPEEEELPEGDANVQASDEPKEKTVERPSIKILSKSPAPAVEQATVQEESRG